MSIWSFTRCRLVYARSGETVPLRGAPNGKYLIAVPGVPPLICCVVLPRWSARLYDRTPLTRLAMTRPKAVQHFVVLGANAPALTVAAARFKND